MIIKLLVFPCPLQNHVSVTLCLVSLAPNMGEMWTVPFLPTKGQYNME